MDTLAPNDVGARPERASVEDRRSLENGNDYGVGQNEQAAEVLERLVDQIGGAHYVTTGSLRRGKSVFLTLMLPMAMEVAGADRMDLYPDQPGPRSLG